MGDSRDQTSQSTEIPSIALRDGVVRFGATTVLHGVDLELHPGTIHALVGQNGAGKTTLVKALIGVNELSGGSIEVDGSRRTWSGPQDARAAGLEIVYQDQPLIPHFTVLDNMFLGRESTKGPLLDRSEMRRTAEEVLREIDADCEPDELVEDLTRTQRVQVSIAAALAANPSVLILDEPTAALGGEESQPVFRLIRAAARRGVAILYISHRLAEITSLADHVTVLRDGRVVLSTGASGLATEAMVTAMVGSDLDALFPDRDRVPGEVLLEIEGLRSEPLVHDVSFTVRAGEIVGLAGLVGSGAAESVAALFGDRTVSGQVKLKGQSAESRNSRQAAAKGFALVPPERRTEAVFAGVSLRDNITAASLEKHSRVGVVNRSAERSTAQRVVDQLGVVAEGLSQDFATLSGGNQQKAIVGRWLERGADVFLVSEPTAGVDVAARIEIYRQLGVLAENGSAVVVSSTDFEELVGLCDRILIVRDGRVTGEVAAHETDVERLTTLTAAQSVGQPISNDEPEPRAAEGPSRRRGRARLRQISVPLAMLAVLAVLAAGAPSLLSAGSLVGILNQAATPALLAAALAVALGSGSFDLSIGATAHFSANLSAAAVIMGWPPLGALILGVAAGTVVGVINGAIAGVLRVPSFVATLGMLFLLVGLTLGLNGGLVTSIPRTSNYLLFGQGWILRFAPVLVVWTLITVAILTVLWRRTRMGMRLRAVGDDASVAALRGVQVRKTTLLGLVMSGTLSGMAGALMASYSSGANANDVSLSLLVSALAAAFLGLSMTRGLLFDPATAVIGALFVTAVGVGLIANGLPDQLLTGVQGLALLFAVLVAVARRRQLGQVAIF